jgi:hypothetical protein
MSCFARVAAGNTASGDVCFTTGRDALSHPHAKIPADSNREKQLAALDRMHA